MNSLEEEKIIVEWKSLKKGKETSYGPGNDWKD